MARRTFGWIQNPSSTLSLKKVVALFSPDSMYFREMLEVRLPLLNKVNLFASSGMYESFVETLQSGQSRIPYDILKGKGCGKGNRATAKCSGLAQAAVDGQQFRTYIVDGEELKIRKPYVDDWSADGFLRWAVSIGLLNYHSDDDSCSITELGRDFVNSTNKREHDTILGRAYLSYPPACRVLEILNNHGHSTKFEIGRNLGFTDEAGFTSWPQNIWVQAYIDADDQERSRLRSDVEGSSDKYARMICGWLAEIGWVVKTPKTVIEDYGGRKYKCDIAFAYMITAKGRTAMHRALGMGGGKRIPKIVYKEMLASKASNADSLRMRRAYILEILSKHSWCTPTDIQLYLRTKNCETDMSTIYDDLKGLKYIGINIENINGRLHLKDILVKLDTKGLDIVPVETGASAIKERVRPVLRNIDHKYLALIDYAFSGRKNCAEFEIFTIDLLTNELSFSGIHLGGTRKPDGIFSYNNNGVIIDNKAYSNGFTITRSMADEMTRYVQENNDRNPQRNANQWWKNFGGNVNHFNFVFISSMFKGEIEYMLKNIKESTDGISGSVLNVENLLYYAEALKTGQVSYESFVARFGDGREILFPKEIRYAHISENSMFSIAAESSCKKNM